MSVNGMENDGDAVECPLCMETLDLDDKGFYPCPCGYQICRFCWHRLSNLEDNPEYAKGSRGLCPACRQEYPEAPVCFNSNLTAEAMLEQVKNKKKKKKQANKQKQKQMEEKQKLKEILKNQEKNLAGLRVVQKNLVFVIGIPTRLTQEDLRREFLKFGKIHKLVITSCTSSVNTAYVTYARPEDAMKTILALNQQNNQNSSNAFIVNGWKDNKSGGKNGLTLKASLGTTKYCTHWLRSQQCPKLPDCMYLHELADSDASFTKEEIQKAKHTEYEKKLINQYLNKGNSKHAKCPNQRVDTQNEDPMGKQADNYSSTPPSLLSSQSDALKRPPSADSNEKIHLNTLDEIIGSSSDSISTSYSTCSSGSSCPPSLSPTNQREYEDSSQKMMMQSEEAMPQSPAVAMDDDGLDFDPISISTNGLQDLIRSSSDENCTSSAPLELFSQNPKSELPNQNMEHVWRNSLKALLPNVNITFANSAEPMFKQQQQQQHQPQQQQQQQQQQGGQNISSLGSMLPQMVPGQLGCDQYASWYSSHHRPNQLPNHHHPQPQQSKRHLSAASLQRLYSSNGGMNSDLQLGLAPHFAFMSQTVPCQPPPGFANF